MDDTDRQLLSLLRDNARASVASLAKLLRVSRGTVQNRLHKLEADGTIVGYTTRLRPLAEAQRIRALMTVEVVGTRTDQVLSALRGDPAVSALHTTNGRWDIVAELQADSLESFDLCSAASACSTALRTPRPACCCQRTSCEALAEARRACTGMQLRPASQQTMGAVYGVPTDKPQRAKKTIVFYLQRLHTTSCLNGTSLNAKRPYL
jgi:DNA-binding Lrp family transcriptional regulator